MAANKIKVELTINHQQVLHAVLLDNATTRSLLKRMPFTIQMQNLYDREMCHRFGPGGLPLDYPQSAGYQVGDLSYWPPMGSLVILYAQNGEVVEQQKLGHIKEPVSFFSQLATAEVTFKQE